MSEETMKEVVMLMPPDEYALLGQHVRRLMPRFNTRGLKDTVMAALAAQIARLDAEEPA